MSEIKILAFAASNSKTSINRDLVGYMARRAAEAGASAVAVETLELHEYELPLYRPDRQEEGGMPELAQRFFDKVGAADALIISFAEHNWSFNAAYKNLFDWASRIEMKVYRGKPALLMATSPGRGGGGTVLKTALTLAPQHGLDVKASVSVPSFNHVFDRERGEPTDPGVGAELEAALAQFLEALRPEAA